MVKKKKIALGKGAAALFGNVNAAPPLENERKPMNIKGKP